MLIFLPPSESKADTPLHGPPVQLQDLSFGELTAARIEVAEALAHVSASAEALGLLGVGASLADDVKRNLDWRSAPALPGSRLYTGVLYDALDYATLSPTQRATADSTLVVFSGLWGALRFRDAVAPYRMSMDAQIGLGRMATWWKPRLTPVLDQAVGEHLIVDLRSSTYATAYAPRGPIAERTVTVSAVQETIVAGAVKRQVISHMAKHTRGLVARWLLRSRANITTPQDVARVCRQAAPEGWDVELDKPVRAHQKWTLTVVQRS